MVRWFSGPITSMAACPQRSMLSRTSPVKPMRSATTSSGKARASASIASKEPLLDEVGDQGVGLGVDLPSSPRRARGVRFAERVARSCVCTGGSEASDVPWSASLTIGLKPIDDEEKVSGSPSASRMTS